MDTHANGAKRIARILKFKGAAMKLSLVKNWKKGWKWFSTWAFALIVFFATTPLPPEVLNLIPHYLQKHFIAIVAMCGLILRFVGQSKDSSHDAGQSDPYKNNKG